MRKRIFRISEDEFSDPAPQIRSSYDSIEATLDTDSAHQGYFGLYSDNHVAMRGVVYSSNPYVYVTNPQFDDTSATIYYEIDDYHFTSEDVIEGQFTVICNQAELAIPYRFCFQRLPQSALKSMENLEQFAVYAQGHYKEAVRLFYTQEFADWIEDKAAQRIRGLYRGYRSLPGARNFDEFLVSAGVKPVCYFDTDIKKAEFYGVEENQKELITLTRSTWGFIDIEVSADADFLTLESRRVTSDFFLGSILQFNYYIHADRLHDGINLARITFRSPEQSCTVEITASRKTKAQLKIYKPSAVKQYTLSLCRMYEEYRLGRMSRENWCEKSEKILQALTDLDPDNFRYILMKTQVLIVAGRRQEALYFISELKRDIPDHKSTEWAYLLYLCTLIEQEEKYIDRLTGEIEHILVEHTEDVTIFWFLLFLRKSYPDNPGQKLKDIFVWLNAGYRSPFLLMEAYEILSINPYMISDFAGANRQVLKYAARHGALTPDMAEQVLDNLFYETIYDRAVWKLALAAYDTLNDPANLEPLTRYLIKFRRFSPMECPYYQKAIEAGIRMNGLYEAYILSRSLDATDPIPEIVLKYFQYDSVMSYERKALVYAEIINRKAKDGPLYNQYCRQIEEFAIANMKAGNIDDNLAIIYDEVVRTGLLDGQTAQSMAPLLYMRKIGCLYSGVSRVVVHSQQQASNRIYPVHRNIAYVTVLSDQDVIFLEHAGGYMIADTNAYSVSDLFDYAGLEDKLSRLAPKAPEYILHKMSVRGVDGLFDYHGGDHLEPEEIERIHGFLESPLIAESYRLQFYSSLIRILKDHGREDVLTEHLLDRVDFNRVDKASLNYIMELMVTDRQTHRAYDMIVDYNVLGMSKKLLASLFGELSWEYVVSSAVIEESKSASDLFTGICGWLLQTQEKLPSGLVQYLNQHYVGPNEQMMKLWHMAQEENLPSKNLEERLLVQMLYRGRLLDGSDLVFDSYIRHGGGKMIREAYLTYESREYLLDRAAFDNTFDYLWTGYVRGDKLNESSRLALLKRLAVTKVLSEEQADTLEDMLSEVLAQNRYFPWFFDLPQNLKIRYQLYDKSYVTYIGQAGTQIVLYYGAKDRLTDRCDMVEMYPGLYVKEFVLFAGDRMNYCVTTADEPEKHLAEGTKEPEAADTVQGLRYSRINAISRDLQEKEAQKAVRDLMLYQGMDAVVSMLFELK